MKECFAFILGLILGLLIAASGMAIRYQQEAIKHGFAEYNPQTGYWQWKEGAK